MLRIFSRIHARREALRRRQEEDRRAMEEASRAAVAEALLRASLRRVVEEQSVPGTRTTEITETEEPSAGLVVPVQRAVVKATSSRDELWRWLALTVGGTVLPFAVLGLAYWLVAGHSPTLLAMLGRGELFIPASIMNAEAIWVLSYVALPGRTVWFPIMFACCGLAALGGAICYGVTAALDSAPHSRVKVALTALKFLTKAATVLSASEFLLALLVGTSSVVLFMLVRREEGSAA